MTKLRNTRFFTLDPAVWRGRSGPVKVGNNRTLDFEVTPTGAHVLAFRLYNSIVGRMYQLPVRVGETRPTRVEISLSDGGWPTQTTARAQEDFLRALGFQASVSYARGGFRLFLRDPSGENEDVLIELPDRPDTLFLKVFDRYSQRRNT